MARIYTDYMNAIGSSGITEIFAGQKLIVFEGKCKLYKK